jgi:hypothetical protein
MGYYYHADPAPSDVRVLDDALYAEWVATGNPKAQWWVLIPDPPSPNAQWNGTAWVEPPPYVPQEITRLQGMMALQNAGLLDQAEALVAQADATTQLAWANATHFVRTSPTLLGLAAQLGLTDAELDALFVDGASIFV